MITETNRWLYPTSFLATTSSLVNICLSNSYATSPISGASGLGRQTTPYG